ncbi:hypothetical protein AB0D10_46075 [Kitasatospora sp. NPDC048545]
MINLQILSDWQTGTGESPLEVDRTPSGGSESSDPATLTPNGLPPPAC